MNYDVIVVGCGLSGAVLAERYATIGKKVLILEKRDHIGGNCYDYVDETGILCNRYGAHIFHTNYEDVWEYVNRFDTWERYEHKVLGAINEKIVPIPANITTVNVLCGKHIQTEAEMNDWLKANQIQYSTITNSEEMAKSRVGPQLYDAIFKDYTFKQWGVYPNELKPEVLARIPVRNNFDERYFTDKYQALPKQGYTHFFERLLDHPNITIRLNTDFFSVRHEIPTNCILIYTGPIDRYFADQGYDALEYRSIEFSFERYMNTPYFQQGAVVNYPGVEKPFTRIVEYKHFLHQQSPHTVIAKEVTTSIGEPYYPVLNDRNMKLFEHYKKLAEKERETKNIHFVGRLANYKYFNMDEAIKNALDYFRFLQGN